MGGGIVANTSLTSPDCSMEHDGLTKQLDSSASFNGGDLVSEEIFKELSEEVVNYLRSRRKCRVYIEIMQDYQRRNMVAKEAVEKVKNRILSYKPGSFIKEVGGLGLSHHDIPRITTLLLIGPKGSGKSSLLNGILRVLEGDRFSSPRAQVSYNQSCDGTCFLQGYTIRGESPSKKKSGGLASFSLFDTRSLSENSAENIKLLKSWMVEGVQHGQMVLRHSDSTATKEIMKAKARHTYQCDCDKRVVNFVIYVVDAVSVLKSTTNKDDAQYTTLLTECFNCPYLSFKDDKPVLVITHTDELTIKERAFVRIHLGDILGIPPTTQIFDIPDVSDLSSELTILDMLCYCLEHADKNFPCKQRGRLQHVYRYLSCKQSSFLMNLDSVLSTAEKMVKLMLITLGALFVAGVVTMFLARRQQSEDKIDWHAIRYMWMG